MSSIPADQTAQLITLYQAGLALAEIAARMGLPLSTITQRLNRLRATNQVALRPKSQQQQGERHNVAKLTEAQARAIFAAAVAGKETQLQIAARYGVDQKTPSDIKLGRSWPHIRADYDARQLVDTQARRRFTPEVARQLIAQHQLGQAVFYKWREKGLIPAIYFEAGAQQARQRYRQQHGQQTPFEQQLGQQLLQAVSNPRLHQLTICRLAGVAHPRLYDARRGVSPLPLADLVRLSTALAALRAEARHIMEVSTYGVDHVLSQQLVRRFANREQVKTRQFAAEVPLLKLRNRLTHWLFGDIKGYLSEEESRLLLTCLRSLETELTLPVLVA